MLLFAYAVVVLLAWKPRKEKERRMSPTPHELHARQVFFGRETDRGAPLGSYARLVLFAFAQSRFPFPLVVLRVPLFERSALLDAVRTEYPDVKYYTLEMFDGSWKVMFWVTPVAIEEGDAATIQASNAPREKTW